MEAVMSGHVERKPYDYALLLLHQGSYEVDAERGAIVGRKGRDIGSIRGEGPGYGYTWVTLHGGSRDARVTVPAHRLIWEWSHGPIPDGMEINHKNGNKSDNRLCNLEVVTPSENQLHAHRIGLKRGQRGEASPLARLSQSMVDRIRTLHAQGTRQSDVAAATGVSRPQVSRIVRGLTWKSCNSRGGAAITNRGRSES